MADYPRLKIEKFIWNREEKLEVVLPDGLSILTGHDQIYRTAVFRLLQYAWGNDAGRISDDELKKSDSVEIFLQANEVPISIVRSTAQSSSRFRVFAEEYTYSYLKKRNVRISYGLVGPAKAL